MLLSQFKQVIDIDSKISSLHSELNSLYKEREHLVSSANSKPQANTVAVGLPKQIETPNMLTPQKWATQTYQELKETWGQINITIPSERFLIAKLKKAYNVIADIYDEQPQIAKDIRPILVPPTKKVSTPIKNSIRSHQDFIFDQEYIQPEILLTVNGGWKLLLVYVGEKGIKQGDARTITEDKSYKIGKHDMRGLGVSEYLALTIQSKTAIDTNTWTLLLKESTEKGQVVAARFMNGRYRIELTEDEDLFGDVTFRPAIEVR